MGPVAGWGLHRPGQVRGAGSDGETGWCRVQDHHRRIRAGLPERARLWGGQCRVRREIVTPKVRGAPPCARCLPRPWPAWRSPAHSPCCGAAIPRRGQTRSDPGRSHTQPRNASRWAPTALQTAFNSTFVIARVYPLRLCCGSPARTDRQDSAQVRVSVRSDPVGEARDSRVRSSSGRAQGDYHGCACSAPDLSADRD